MGSSNLDPCDEATVEGDTVKVSCTIEVQSEAIRNRVTLADFCIDEHEVTIDQYRHCVARGECGKPLSTNAGNSAGNAKGHIQKYYTNFDTYGSYPVVGVTWRQAMDYCAFHGGGLPTEAQWEYAAVGRTDNERIIDESVLTDIVTRDCTDHVGAVVFGPCTDREIQPVTSRSSAHADVTQDNVFDMAASVAEWVADEFDFLAYCARDQQGDSIYDLFEMKKRPLTPSILSAGGVPNRYVEDPNCLDNRGADPEGCRDLLETCLGRCRNSFGPNGGTTPDSKRNHWRRAYCDAVVEGNGRLEDDATDGECEATDRYCTSMDVAVCTELCDCMTEAEYDETVTPTNGTLCLQGCFDDYRGCANECIDVPDVQVSCLRQNEQGTDRGRPIPWCQARQLSAEESAVPHRVEAGFVRETGLENAHVVRGADFQDTKACNLRHSRRRFHVTASPKVGFRCAYKAGSERCQRR